jgi:C-terminal processing protease CtpA/Prc
MRGVFGLAAVLVGIGVLVWFLGRDGGAIDQQRQTLQTGQQMQQQVQQMGGVGAAPSQSTATGATPLGGQPTMKFNESLTLEPEQRGGKIVGLKVATIVDGGPAATYYGLQVGDVITEAMQMKIRDNPMISTPEDGMTALLESFQRTNPITVTRNGQELKLPQPKNKNVPTH